MGILVVGDELIIGEFLLSLIAFYYVFGSDDIITIPLLGNNHPRTVTATIFDSDCLFAGEIVEFCHVASWGDLGLNLSDG